MKTQQPPRHSDFDSAMQAMTNIWRKKRGRRSLVFFCFLLFILAVVWLTFGKDYYERGDSGWSIPLRTALSWLSQSVQAQSGNAPTFTVFDAPGAGTGMLQGTFGTSINDAGDIAGIYLTAPNVAHGFVRTAGNGTPSFATFDAPGAGTSKNQGTFPASINASGDIAGMYFDSSNAYHGFLRTGSTGSITPIDVSGAPTNIGHRGTLPVSMNANGDIAGFYVDANDVRHGFIRTISGGTASFTTVDAPNAGTNPKQGTTILSINAAGDVTGLYVDTGKTSHAFLRKADGTLLSPIDAPGAGTGPGGKVQFMGTIALGFDAAGDIAGTYADVNSVNHGFIYSAASANPTFTIINVPGAGSSGLFASTVVANMNAGGDVSGIYNDASGVRHGFLRLANGTFTNPIDAPSVALSGMFSGTLLVSINTQDDITGAFLDSSAVFHAFSLAAGSTPPPPPPAAIPTFGPAPGNYTSQQMVTISDTTAGATIHFTVDGSTPTDSSPVFTTPISVDATTTFKAIAAAPGFSDSPAATATYTFNPDFQVSVNPQMLTIVAGQSGMATFTVTPVNGFNSQVSFACSGLPSEAACNFSPTSVTPNGAAASSTLTVTTTAQSAVLRMPMPMSSQRPTYALILPVLVMIFGITARRRVGSRGWRLSGLLILALAVSGLTSCGSGNPRGNPGTPLGTSSLSVTASTNGAGGTSHAATLTITVTH